MHSALQIIKQYGSQISTIRCQQCGKEKKFYSYQLPNQDFSVHCKACNHRFVVKVEKRKKFRVKIIMTISFSKWGDPREVTNPEVGDIINLSGDGFCIEYHGRPNDFKPGDIIYFCLLLPGNSNAAISSSAVLRWVRTTNPNEVVQKLMLGTRFQDLDMYQRKVLGFFLMGRINSKN